MSSVLVLDAVSKGFSRGGREWVSVLSDVSLEVGAGEVAAVVGGRLAGKSTLLQVAAGMVLPESGSVCVHGRELTGLSGRARSQLLGEQVAWLDCAGPAQELIEVSRFVGWPLALRGGRRRAEARAGQMLDRVGALDCVGRRWGELSNWQRVLVGLARAFVGGPRLVVIDDVLDGLSSRDRERAGDLLRSLMEQGEQACAVLMGASELDSAIHADRVWTLRNGNLALIAGGTQDADVIPLRAVAGGLSQSVGL